MEGREFGRYRLGRLIGSGGMGDVFEAVDVDRDRVVALKLLPELFGGNEEFLARFRRESRVVARLRDPHIIPIHDYGEIDGRLFIDMRLVDDGVTIARLLSDDGPLPARRTVDLVVQVADALDAAHADGLVHRDVKPSNVLVTPRDFVYVVDFGIAHAIGHTAAGLTGTGSTVGTLDYMAPERFTSRSIDGRADVYSLACLLHQCLTGRPPFEGDSLPALMYAHLDLAPPRPSDGRPWLPAALDDVVATGMAKDPGDRFPTAGALADAARRAVEAAPTRERTPAVAVAGRRSAPTLVSGPDSSTTAPQPLDTPESPLPTSPARIPPPVFAPVRPQGGAPPVARPQRFRRDGTTVRVSRTDVAGWLRDRPVLVVVAIALVVVLAVVLAAALAPDREPAAASPAPAPAAGPSVPVSLAVPAVAGTIATPPTPGYLAVAPGGRTGYLANRDARVVSVIDLDRRAVVATIPMPVATPRFVALSADGARAFVSCYDERGGDVVHVVDTRTNAVTATIPVDREPYALAVAPDQRTLWVPSHATGSIDVVDLSANAVVRRIPVGPNPHWIAFGPHGIYVANHESNLVTSFGPDGAARATVPVGRSPHALAVSPDGERVAVVNYDAGTVDVLDARTDRVLATVSVGRGPQHVSYTPDGRHLHTANVDDGTVSVIDTATDTVTATVPACGSPTSVGMRGVEAVVTCLDDGRLLVLRAST
ncbi:serine/threonine-protein kinase [Actinomycetospora soli]|uniref:serine/threonine-protein kinase n=1 Tax=Actinomycetospora soli TaxID=2893887 RepID=UPI001E61E681|nr:serine/threonine-protein kinase [Actinomycetospora soli]MCD2189975.1 protein kinase [Actinomycetospora soli]